MLESECFYKFTKFCQILILTLWLVNLPYFLPEKNSSNIAKSNRVFPGKGRGDRALILKYLDSPMAKVFPHYCLFFFYFGHLPGKTGVQSWNKCTNFGSVSLLWKLESFNFFQTMFLFARVLLLVRMSAILDHIWGSKGPKTSLKGPIHGCWISTKNL